MSLVEDIEKEEAGVSLLEELESTPEESREYTESEQWRPEEGDSIEGVVVERYSFESSFKDAKTGVKPTIPGMTLKVDGDDTLWSVAGLHGILREYMVDEDPQPGDRVAVIYSGKREGKEFDYHHYRFAIRRGNGSVKPVPAQRVESNNGAGKAAGSTQHEPVKREATKAAPARRKPGAKATEDTDPDF